MSFSDIFCRCYCFSLSFFISLSHKQCGILFYQQQLKNSTQKQIENQCFLSYAIHQTNKQTKNQICFYLTIFFIQNFHTNAYQTSRCISVVNRQGSILSGKHQIEPNNPKKKKNKQTNQFNQFLGVTNEFEHFGFNFVCIGD